MLYSTGKNEIYVIRSDGTENRKLADVGLGVPGRQARLPHQLFGVVRPPLGECVADEDAAEQIGRPVRVQELQEVAGPDFMCGDKQEIGTSGNIGLALRLGPLRLLAFPASPERARRSVQALLAPAIASIAGRGVEVW